MELVIMFWIIMLVIVISQLCAIIHYMRHDRVNSQYDSYTNEVIEKTNVVMRAVRSKTIKKHLLTNSADEYDSRKTLKQYRVFLNSDLMKDMMQMHEDQYHG